MPVEFGIWRIDGGLRKVPFIKLGGERRLEDILVRDVSILGLDVMVAGRQVATSYGKRIDLLAIDAGGDLYAIELKRDRTPREVVAQLLDYGSWVKDLGHEDISALFSEHQHGARLEEEFENRFGDVLPDALNQEHHLVIVASEVDNSTERIVLYLSGEFSVPVSVLFFRYYIDGDGSTWLGPGSTPRPARRPQAPGRAKLRHASRGMARTSTSHAERDRTATGKMRSSTATSPPVAARSTPAPSTSCSSAAGSSSTYLAPDTSAWAP